MVDPDRILAAIQELTADRLKGPDGKSRSVLVVDGPLRSVEKGLARRCFAGGILTAEERPGVFRVQTGLRILQGCIVEPCLGRIREPRVFLCLRPCRGQTHQACLNRSDDAVPCACQAVLRILAAGGRLPAIWLMLLSTVFSPSYLLIWAGTVEVRRTVLVQD